MVACQKITGGFAGIGLVAVSLGRWPLFELIRVGLGCLSLPNSR